MAWSNSRTYCPANVRESQHTSVTELAQMLGRTGSMFLRDECTVQVKVVDVKLAYGNVRYLVEPLAGSGQTWISESSLTWID